MFKIIVVELERILFRLTGVELPTLRKSWEAHADYIQYRLDVQHNTNYSKTKRFKEL
jgi:hypothetical protein